VPHGVAFDEFQKALPSPDRIPSNRTPTSYWGVGGFDVGNMKVMEVLAAYYQAYRWIIREISRISYVQNHNPFAASEIK
jgi:hypothetical protein